MGLEVAGERNASGTNCPGRAHASSQREPNLKFPGPGWRMDSTACLVGSDAPHVELPFQFLPVGQCDMEEDNPIARHRKLKASFVATRVCFFRLCEPGTHARVRHISLNCNMRAGNWLGDGIGQLQSDRGETNPCWFG